MSYLALSVHLGEDRQFSFAVIFEGPSGRRNSPKSPFATFSWRLKELKDAGMGMIDWVLCACVDGALEMAVGLEGLFGMSRGSFWRKGTGADWALVE